MAALDPLSEHIGLSVDLPRLGKSRRSTARWIGTGKKPDARSRSTVADTASPFLLQLSRLQPPAIQSDWPPARDGGAKKSEGKPLFFTLDPAGGELAQEADAYDKAVLPAIA